MLGSYSDSSGIEVIRRHVADYIARRDGGIASDYIQTCFCPTEPATPSKYVYSLKTVLFRSSFPDAI